jgi:two-component system LytT family response regulator
MIKAVLIDDESSNLENLARLLEKYCPEVAVVAMADNAGEGREAILVKMPDLVFLDIQMPGMNGFELLASLPRHPFEVIFVTAHDRYGIQAVKFAAIDYLLKPIDIAELKQAVGKAIAKVAEKSQNLQLQHLFQRLKQQDEKGTHRLALPTARETRFVRPEDIIRCESSNSYTQFYLSTGEKYLVSRPIYEYEELLKDYGFFRCHQSHLINKQSIKSWIKEDGDHLLMADGARVPVSRQKRGMLRQMIGLDQGG